MGKTNKVGINSTLPVEVILAAGKVPVELNNAFIASADAPDYVRNAEAAGFGRNVCTWIKGVYSAAVKLGLSETAVVVAGDCSNAIVLADIFRARGVNVVPFAYPREPRRDLVEREIDDFALAFGTTLADAEAVFDDLRPIRRKLAAIDRMTWYDGTVSGRENALLLNGGCDFEGDPTGFGRKLDTVIDRRRAQPPLPGTLRLAVLGIPPIIGGFYERLAGLDCRVVFNETVRQFGLAFEADSLVDAYRSYSYPYGLDARLADIKREIGRRDVEAAIHYTQSFCFHALEDSLIRDALKVPVLTIEGDLPLSMDERTLIRIEGFVESVRKKARSVSVPGSLRRETAHDPIRASSGTPPLRLGLDLGSRSVKAILSRGDAEVARGAFDTLPFYESFASSSGAGLVLEVAELLNELGAPYEDGIEVVSTGYGRNTVDFAGARTVSEIAAHAAGATGKKRDFVLLDIGGQDTKVVLVRGGEVADFVMNDKCAAGGGRYLENMAATLRISLGELSRHIGEPRELNPTCATFAESEIVGLIAAGVPVPRLAAGVNLTVVRRALPLVERFSARLPLLVGGGVALNGAIVDLLAAATGRDVEVLDDPVFNAARGCLRLGAG